MAEFIIAVVSNGQLKQYMNYAYLGVDTKSEVYEFVYMPISFFFWLLDSSRFTFGDLLANECIFMGLSGLRDRFSFHGRSTVQCLRVYTLWMQFTTKQDWETMMFLLDLAQILDLLFGFKVIP